MKKKQKLVLKFFLTISIFILFSSCADLFEKRIGFEASFNNANLSNLIIAPPKITKLDTPKQIHVTQAEFPNKIIITWEPVLYAKYYCLERAISKEKDINGNFIQPTEDDFTQIPLANNLSVATYTDTILSDPKYSAQEYSYCYFYRVCATHPECDSSDYIISEPAYLLAPPTNVVASLGEFADKITIKWDKAKNAKSYDIYRSLNSDGSASIKIGTVTANQNYYTNPISTSDQGKDFYYTIVTKARSTDSVASSLALGYGLQEGAPPKVSNVKVTTGRGDSSDKICISWDAAIGSGIKYAIYRTSSKDSSYTLLSQNSTSTSYEDKKSLQENIYYYYQIQAYTENGEEKIKGPFSDSSRTSLSPAEGFIISAPLNIEVSKIKGDLSNCQLQFTAPIGSKHYLSDSKLYDEYNNYDYIILGSDSNSGPFSVIQELSESSLTKTAQGYFIVPTIDSRKFYKIQTKLNSVISKESELCAPSPFEAQNVIATKAEFIAGYTDSDSNANELGVHAVKITWEAPDGNDAEGGYYIYRSTKPDSGFKKVNDEPIKNNFYFDKNEMAKAGIYYYYKILSLNSLLQGSNYSKAVIGYGALTATQYMREYNKTIINSQKKLTLMHNPDDMKKLGSESALGALSGNLSYNAKIDGLGARITMHYQDYADFYINNDKTLGFYFLVTGDTNTSASMDASGTMDGTVVCVGMYEGSVGYNNLKIKGGGAAGGTYEIKRKGFPSTVSVDWRIGEEGK